MPEGRQIAPWVLLAALLVATLAGLYWLIERFSTFDTSPGFDQFMLPALSLALLVLSLALAAVLIRNLVRLIVDRKRGVLGSRLRTKLVFFFLALVLLPSTVLFVGSAQIIKQTVEAILRTPLEDLTRQSEELVDQWTDYFQDRTLRQTSAIAREIRAGDLDEPPQREQLLLALERWQIEHDLELVRLVDGDRVVAQAGQSGTTANAELSEELERLIQAAVADVNERGDAVARVSHFGQGLLAFAARRIEPEGSEPLVVAVGAVLPARLAGNLEGFAAANQNYRKFRARRSDLVRLYLSSIALIFLVTVFIATWVGLYLSRRITVPIEEMAGAARAISAGNLDVRIHTQVGDEVGTLVDAFNDMTAELQESREVITRSTADLRQSNRALDDRRRYIETLLANLSTAVISLDPAGRVTTANPAVHTILGIELRPGDETLLRLVEADLIPLAELLERELSGAGSGLPHDLSLTHRGGLHVAVQVSPLRSGSDERVGTLVMLEDLTDLMRAQRAAAWREVAQRIAHEIKNPLTPIQLSAQRLRKKFASGSEDLDRVVSESTASIEREVAGLKQLVDEFSKFARMPEITPQRVSFPALVESVLALYESVDQIEWDVELDPAIGEVFLDPQQIRRVMINLIDNAVAALGDSGKICIRAEQVGNEGLRLEVADTGPGIPHADRERMFVPYFSTKKRGSGLGLAIVHKVVTDHRGTIRVEDNQPTGARFVIDLPA